MTDETKRRTFSLDWTDLYVVIGAVLLAAGLAWIHPALLLVAAGGLLIRLGTS